jgi:hypothetical protein
MAPGILVGSGSAGICSCSFSTIGVYRPEGILYC